MCNAYPSADDGVHSNRRRWGGTSMRAHRSLILFWLVLATLVAACAGPSPSGPGAPDGGDSVGRTEPTRMTVAIRGDPKSLSAKLNSAAGAGGTPGAAEIEEMVNAGLGIRLDTGVIHPQLAENIPTVENGLWKVFPDGRMETTWKVREGVRWHDGTQFTTDDLLFTAMVERDADLPIFRDVSHDSIESLDAPDPRTIVVTWSRPFVEADTLFTSTRGLPMPRHLLEQTYLEDKENFTNHPFWASEMVGTGAYKLQDYVLGSHLVLQANDRYVLGRPKIDQVEVRFIPDPSTIGANILAGEVDTTLGGRLSIEWGIQIRDQWSAGRMEITPPTAMISAYPQFMNPSPPVIGSQQFRQALLYAVDRQQIIDSLTGGLAPIGNSIIPEDDADYRDIERSVVRYPFDPARASQMIQSLGYNRGTDTMFRDSSNQPLSVEMRTQSTDDAQMKTMLAIADFWQQAGVAVEQLPVPQQRAQDREYRATRPAFELVRQPGRTRNLIRFYGPNTPLPDNNFTGENRTRHVNPEFDALIDRFYSTIPRQERMPTLAQIVQYMTDQVLILPMYWDPTPTMVSNRLANISDFGEVWDVHLWEVR
ncbi:MAG: hypothetical protein GEU73_08130 [Chloroflexi bacterium]|nr:hypothetical protein [Chloroflexota bacterium]